MTVVTHELGHILGFASIDAAVKPNDWMTATLGTGVRRLPEPLAPDPSPQGGEGSLMLLLSLNLGPVAGQPIWSVLADATIDSLFSIQSCGDFLADSYMRQPTIGSPLVLEFARITDDTSLAVQDFDLAEPMPLDDGDGMLVAGDGGDIIIGEPGEMVLIGGFAQ